MTTESEAGDIGHRLSIICSPRERWSLAEHSLDALLREMPQGAELVYVDGGSPDATSSRLRTRVEAVGGMFLRHECILTGNEARNLALPHCTREYVLFIDNDVEPLEGFAERLVACADETGAAIVGPVILHGRDAHAGEIHVAGGDLRINNGRMDRNSRHFEYQALDDVEPLLKRQRSQQLEFHCLMMRRSFIDELGPLDEELRTLGDHEDVLLYAHRHGHEAWVEPSSRVVYLKFPLVTDDEIGYWQLRWCEEWNKHSLDHLMAKWGIETHKGWPIQARRWAATQRTRWYHGRGPAMELAGKAVRFGTRYPVIDPVVRFGEQHLMNRRAVDERARRRTAGRP